MPTVSDIVPAISVIIPAYNAQATLGEQLDAFARQTTDAAFEVIVCDNGSTDGTASLILERQQQHPWLRLVDASEHRGPAAARNIGVAGALSPLLAFCDADDVAADDWVDAMLDALQTESFVTGALEGDRLLTRRGSSISWISESVYQMPFMPRLVSAGTNNMGMRRALFEEVGGFFDELRTSEDTDLSWRIQLAGYHLALRPEIVMHVRRREGWWAVFLQGYHYGVGDELLRARYADVITAIEQGARLQDDLAVAGRTARKDGAGRIKRVARAVVRRRGRALTPDHFHRLGHWLGARSGRKQAPKMQRLSVPEQLPPMRGIR